MIKVNGLYPNEQGKKFDMEYYLNGHIPMVQEKVGATIKGGGLEQGLSSIEPGSPPTYVAMGYMLFDSVEAFQSAFGPHAQAIMADRPNFTDIQPTYQISDVKMKI